MRKEQKRLEGVNILWLDRKSTNIPYKNAKYSLLLEGYRKQFLWNDYLIDKCGYVIPQEMTDVVMLLTL